MIRILIIIIGISKTLNAQDDLLDLIDDGFENTYPVNATFKAKRIVNSQSIEMPNQNIRFYDTASFWLNV